MNFLITGGAGSVGRDLTASLLKKGHRVRVLDKHAETLGPLHDNKLDLIPGNLKSWISCYVIFMAVTVGPSWFFPHHTKTALQTRFITPNILR